MNDKPCDRMKTIPRLGQRGKRLLVCALMRSDQVFKHMHIQVRPESFPNPVHAFLWRHLVGLHTALGRLPQQTEVRERLEAELAADPAFLHEATQQEVWKVFDAAYAEDIFCDPIPTHVLDWLIGKAGQLLAEQIAAETVSTLNETDGMLQDLPGWLAAKVARAADIESLNAAPQPVAFADDWVTRVALDIRPTGVGFLDRFLGGGHVPGEVYGLLGPYGSCKTMLAVMLAVEAAHHFALTEAPASRPTIAFIVSYEAPLSELRLRALSYAARIPRDTLEAIGGVQDLSRTGNLRDYEPGLFPGLSMGMIPGEFERVQQLIPLFNRHLFFIDMTARGYGSGGITEIVAQINKVLTARGNARCGFVVIDYAGALVRRQISMTPDFSRQLRLAIAGTPLQARSAIASGFRCPVWLLHQLSGNANGKTAGAMLDHTDAAESRSFGENLDFAFVIGRPTLENIAVLRCTKHRRQPSKKSTLIRIDGAFNRVLAAGDEYYLDAQSKSIISILGGGQPPQAPG